VAEVYLTCSLYNGNLEVGVLKSGYVHILEEDERNGFVLAVTRTKVQLQHEEQSKIDKEIDLSDANVIVEYGDDLMR